MKSYLLNGKWHFCSERSDSERAENEFHVVPNSAFGDAHPREHPRGLALRSNVCSVRSGSWPGAVRVNTAFSRPSGGAAQRLDAVRFPNLDGRIRHYRMDVFLADLPGATSTERIEATSKLKSDVHSPPCHSSHFRTEGIDASEAAAAAAYHCRR